MNAQYKIHALVENWHDRRLLPSDYETNSPAPPASQIGGYRKLREELEYLDRIKYERYVPTLYSNHPVKFFERLYEWLNNEIINEDERRLLFEFASRLYFSHLTILLLCFVAHFLDQ